MATPGPNDPDTAYPSEEDVANPNLLSAQAPDAAPAQDTPLFKLVNAAGGELVAYYPTYEEGAVVAGDFTVKIPDGQTVVDTQLSSDVARVSADDQGTGAHAHMGVDDGVSQLQTAFGSNIAMIQAGEGYANLYIAAPADQIDAGNPVVTINRAGFARLQIYGNGDIKVMGSSAGLILSSPNGTGYRLSVDNSGNLTTAQA